MRDAIALVLSILMSLAATLAPAALAGPNAAHKIAVHVVSHGLSCKSLPVFTGCSQIVNTYPGIGDIDVIPVFYDVSEAKVVEFGLTWPADWGTCAYTDCWGILAVGGIANPGDGIATCVSECDRAWAIDPGFGWIHASGPGTVSIIPNPPSGGLGVVNCDEDSMTLDWPACTFSAAIGGGAAEDPCGEARPNPLGIAVDDGRGTACAARGDSVTYTLTYDNSANPSEMRGAYIVNRYEEAFLEFVSATSGGVKKAGKGQVVWSIGTLGPGETGSVQVTLRVLPSADSSICVTASMTCDRAPRAEAAIWTAVCALPLQSPDTAAVTQAGTVSTEAGGGHARNLDAKVAIHVKAHGTACAALPDFRTCEDIVTTLGGCGDLDFIPVFFDLAEVRAVSVGVTWPEEWGSCAFTRCPCDASLGNIVHPGDGTSSSWHSCKRSWAVAPGYGWLVATGPGWISAQPWGRNSELGVANCGEKGSIHFDTPVATFRAGVCGEIGDSPCGAMRGRPTIWDKIKAIFK